MTTASLGVSALRSASFWLTEVAEAPISRHFLWQSLVGKWIVSSAERVARGTTRKALEKVANLQRRDRHDFTAICDKAVSNDEEAKNRLTALVDHFESLLRLGASLTVAVNTERLLV